jgi:hypothetical protein
LKQRGYRDAQIAEKTGLTLAYVKCVIHLVERGEQRLLRAVETGQLPITVAMDIANSEDLDVQAALRSAYEKKLLRGRKLMYAKQLLELRLKHGKGPMAKSKRATPTTPNVYQTTRSRGSKQCWCRKRGRKEVLMFVQRLAFAACERHRRPAARRASRHPAQHIANRIGTARLAHYA